MGNEVVDEQHNFQTLSQLVDQMTSGIHSKMDFLKSDLDERLKGVDDQIQTDKAKEEENEEAFENALKADNKQADAIDHRNTELLNVVGHDVTAVSDETENKIK